MVSLLSALGAHEREETVADLRRRLDEVVDESSNLVSALEAEQQRSAARHEQLLRETNQVCAGCVQPPQTGKHVSLCLTSGLLTLFIADPLTTTHHTLWQNTLTRTHTHSHTTP